ncbi:flagellar FlbD family protein [Alkalicoccobacillus gibsonii]|jgi:flagellar protein FlbD|uniref:Flagellar FlbD family protein n=1 Tax=Alkalicoccobacillus gibsonii TaxID=79881 RepID=A0ABU9VJ32_9BACI|nr:flagellar FlbD family protein [Alkalicoccobacillus gibsonii]MBM0065150.1 flagellar FlbD family protein [Alkalicoccobacillus gibsonii]
MIRLQRLNGQFFLLNALLIEQVEAIPETSITLIGGKKIIVKNEIEDVYTLINDCFEKVGVLGSVFKKGGK